MICPSKLKKRAMMSQKGLSLFKSFGTGGVGRDGKEFILSKDNKLSQFVIAPFDEYAGD